MSPSELPEPSPKLPGVITMEELSSIVRRQVPEEAIRVVADVGAMNGGDSLALKRAFPGARVLAIEGLRDNYERHLQGLPGIESHLAVISGREGSARFFEKSVNGVHSLFERETQDTIRVHEVRTERLDAFCDRLGIDAIDLLKIDVEGATLEVLEGFRRRLPRVAALHVESEAVPFFRGQRLDPEVTELLQGAGFFVAAREQRQGVTGSVVGLQYDTVWIHGRYARA